MTMRHTLMLLAASAAPLCAQQDSPPPPAPAAPAAQAPANAPVPANAPAASQLELRQKALPALALMPAGVDMIAASGNLSAILGPMVPLTLPPHLSFAFGSSGSSTGFLVQLLSTLTLAETGETDVLLNNLLTSLETFKEEKIAPVYLILNMDHQSPAGLGAGLPQALAEDPDFSRFCTRVTANGFEGVKIDLSAWMADALQGDEPLSQENKDRLEAFQGRCLYVMSRQEGISSILALAEDPSQLALAATPADSVLATDKVAEADSTGDGLLLFSYLSPQVCQRLIQHSQEELIAQLTALLQPLLEVGEQATPDEKKAAEEALQGFSLLKQAYMALYPSSATHPYTVKCWYDGDFHLEQKSDAGAYRYEPGILRLAQQAEDPMTALYVEGTSSTIEGLPAAEDLLRACEQLLNGLAVSGQLENLGVSSAELQQGLALYQMFKPQLIRIAEGLGTMGSGLGNSTALVVKAQPDPLIPAAAAFYAPVTNRAKLVEGWNIVLDTAKMATVALGGNPEVLSMLPIVEQDIPGGSAYTIALPTNTPACTPTIQVTDQALVIGSTPGLSTELVQTATGNTPLSGCRLTIQAEPAALIARSIATKLRANCPPPAGADAGEEEENGSDEALSLPSDPDEGASGPVQEEEARPEAPETIDEAAVASTDAEADDEGDEAEPLDDEGDEAEPLDEADEEEPLDEGDEACVEEDEFVFDEYDEPLSEEEKAAAQAEEIASALEFFAQYVRSLQVTGEVQEGKSILRTDVILRR